MQGEQEQDQYELVATVTNDLRNKGGLAMWTVYDHPRDHPEHYVARCFWVHSGGAKPTEHMLVSKSLPRLRMMLHAAGLTSLTRDEQDDSKIVETWL